MHNYGVVDLAGKKIQPGENAAITNMVEKPNNDEAPSNLAITGRYVVSPAIWDLLEYTPPGAGGEIQLTDALLQLIQTRNSIRYTAFTSTEPLIVMTDKTQQATFADLGLIPTLVERLEANND